MRVTLEDLDKAIKGLFATFHFHYVDGVHNVGSARYSNMRLIAEHCFSKRLPEDERTAIIREMLLRMEKRGWMEFDNDPI